MSVRSLPIKACLRLYFHIQHIRQRTFHKPKPAKIRTKKQKTNAPREETAQQQEIAAVSRARLINVFLVTFFLYQCLIKGSQTICFCFPLMPCPKVPPSWDWHHAQTHPSIHPFPPPHLLLYLLPFYSYFLLPSSPHLALSSLILPHSLLSSSSLSSLPFVLVPSPSSLIPLFHHFSIFVPSSLSFFLIITITFRPSFSLRS